MYTALNETISTEEMWNVLYGFFSLAAEFHRDAACSALMLASTQGERHFYEAFILLIERRRRLSDYWIDYVRMNYPVAPRGFEWVGRMANVKRQVAPGPSPRLIAIPDPPFDIPEGT